MTMDERIEHETSTIDEATANAIHLLQERLGEVVLGQDQAIRLVTAGYVAGGHVLLEGIPGIGKTLLARTFARLLGRSFSRIQFTPDLMPADVVGSNILRPGSQQFELLRGPIFNDVLLADEINRTPPKTQAALLEAMQERQATIDGTAHQLPDDFFIIATQNPLEFEGVYPLPEAQLDRFQLRIPMGLPDLEAEMTLMRQAVAGDLQLDQRQQLAEPVLENGVSIRRAASGTHVRDDILEYVQQLAVAVRESPHVELGPSPRAVLALLETARSLALLGNRAFVIPDDVKEAAEPCWAHRIRLLSESELESHTPSTVLAQVVESVDVPH